MRRWSARSESAASRRSGRSLAAVTVLVLLPLLTACGQNPPTPTQPPAAPTAPGEQSGDATTGGVPNTNNSVRATKDQLTLGELQQRMGAAWQGVTTYRATYAGIATGLPATPVAVVSPAASPMASPAAATPVSIRQQVSVTAVREVVMPNVVREVLKGAGNNDHEAIAVNDQLFLRGPFATIVSPGASPNAWLELPTRDLRPDTNIGQVLGGLANASFAPLDTMPQQLSEQVLRDLGTTEIGGRECRLWGAANTTAIGSRIDITIGVDNRDLPCLLETRMGDTVQSSVFWEAFNEPITIAPPTDATPVASPVVVTVPRD